MAGRPKKIAVAGAGFAGVVLSRVLAEALPDLSIDLFDERDHLGGNCHTYRDPETGIMVHAYGPHIFHTDRADVWEFMNRFGKFGPYTNRVKAVTERGVYSLPINLLTINQFFDQRWTPEEARAHINEIGDRSITDPKSFEEQALRFLGKDLYENFFKYYTLKQWGRDPKDLPASILKRLPIRFNYNDNYFSDPYQGIPYDGYTEMMRRMIALPNVNLHLKTRFDRTLLDQYDHSFFSGPIDSFFGHSDGRLRYRTLDFETIRCKGDLQGNAVLNYCEERIEYTRVSDHKYFAPWEEHQDSFGYREFSRDMGEHDIPYYPLGLSTDKELLARYQQLAAEIENLTFIGRLGTYRYLDMHKVVEQSLDTGRRFLNGDRRGHSGV